MTFSSCRDFFAALSSDALCDKVMLVVASDPVSQQPIAVALNLIGRETLYGRNWGILPGLSDCPATKGLHFELCYYQALEFAIERGLARVEAGAQGEHKIQRGVCVLCL
jgi:predicted N-acyltransferase